MTAIKLKWLARAGVCGAKVTIDSGNSSFALRYNGSSEPNFKEDIFNFDSRHQVTSWMREDLNGVSTTLNFASNGDIVSHSQGEQ